MVQNLDNNKPQNEFDPIFLVYNINDSTDNVEGCKDTLEYLGFRKVSVSLDGKAELWSSHTCVLMIKVSQDKPTGISGFGFSCTDDVPMGYLCKSTGFNHTTDNYGGCDIYTVYRPNMPDVIGRYFKANVSSEKNYSWRKFVGICFDHCDENTMDFYQTELCFSKVEETDNYHILVSTSNKFYLYFARKSRGLPPMVMITTSDIFDITAKMEANGISAAVLHLNEHNKNCIKEIDDGNLQYHRVAAWDLAVDGRKNRYVIDNFFPQALPNLDIMATSRFNYNSISEKNLCVFENLREQHV